MWHCCQCQNIKWPKSHVSPHFDCFNIIMEWCYLQCHWHHVIPTLVLMTSYDQQVILHLLLIILTNQCSWATDSAISIPWCQCEYQLHHMTQKLHFTSFKLSWLNQCSSANDDVIGITWYLCQWHHMVKKSCCNSFDHLDLSNGMVPLITLLQWCDTDTSTKNIT